MKEFDPNIDYDALLAEDLVFDPRDRGGSSAPIGAHVVNWRTLPDEAAEPEWAALRSFVEWFTVRYNIAISVVPNCWYQHPALVEELSALHTFHTTSFDPADSGYGPIGWHERLAVAHQRLTRAYSGGCSNGHQQTRPRSWDGVIDETAWTAWTTTAHAHRNT